MYTIHEACLSCVLHSIHLFSFSESSWAKAVLYGTCGVCTVLTVEDTLVTVFPVCGGSMRVRISIPFILLYVLRVFCKDKIKEHSRLGINSVRGESSSCLFLSLSAYIKYHDETLSPDQWRLKVWQQDHHRLRKTAVRGAQKDDAGTRL